MTFWYKGSLPDSTSPITYEMSTKMSISDTDTNVTSRVTALFLYFHSGELKMKMVELLPTEMYTLIFNPLNTVSEQILEVY